jgi:tetratricopeptide (TPR) repeat protein
MEANPELAGDVLDYALELLKQGRGSLAEQILLRLHAEPKAAAIRRQTELAWVILALDAGRTQEAGSLYARYRDAIDQAAPSSRGWLDVVPDALQQVKAEVARRAAQPDTEPAPDPFDRAMVRHTGGPDKRASGDEEAPPLDSKPAVDVQDVASGQQGHSEAAAPNPDGAIRLLDEAIQRNPGNFRLYLIRARLYHSARDFDAAVNDSAKAIELAPDDAAGYRFRAAVYTIQGKLNEALADLTKAIDIDPSDPDVFTVRASVYARLGEPAKAEADLAEARRLARGREKLKPDRARGRGRRPPPY